MKKILLLSLLTVACFPLLGMEMEDDLKVRMERLPREIKGYISDLVGTKIDQKDLDLLIAKITSGKTLSGNSFGVASVAISSDGKHIVTGSGDHTAKIWNASTGELVHTLADHTGMIDNNSIAISPNGNYVVTGSIDRTAKIWSMRDGKLIHTLSGHSGYVASVAISPDGKYVVTGSADNTAKIWDLSTGNLIHTLSGHSDHVTSVAISPDGKYVVTGSWDHTAKIWNAITGALVHTLFGHKGMITSVAISPDSTYVVTGSRDNTAKIWNVNTGSLVHDLWWRGHADAVSSVAISPDGKYIVTGSDDMTAKIWNASTGALEHTLKKYNIWDFSEGHKNRIRSVAISPDSTYVVTGSYDKTAKIWDLHKGTFIHTLSGHSNWIDAIAISPDGTYIVTGSYDKTARIWNNVDIVLKLNDIAHFKKLEGDKKDWPALRITFLLKLIEAIKNEEHLILDSSIQKDGKPGFLYGIYTTMFDKRMQDALAPFIRIK